MIATRLGRIAPVLLASAVACSTAIPSNCPQPPPTVSFGGGVTLHVDVADTPVTRARGLTGRRYLPEGRGMLFVFQRPSREGFWMKDTLIPLSIAFYDERGRVLAIREMTPCRSARCPLYRSPRPFVGAVEANRGYFARHGIGTGDRVRPRIRVNCQ
jgi:uncharacterized protein